MKKWSPARRMHVDELKLVDVREGSEVQVPDLGDARNPKYVSVRVTALCRRNGEPAVGCDDGHRYYMSQVRCVNLY